MLSILDPSRHPGTNIFIVIQGNCHSLATKIYYKCVLSFQRKM